MQHTAGADAGRPSSDPESGIVFNHGVLHVEIFKARNIRGDEMSGLGKADPYLKVKHGIRHKRVSLESGTDQDAGSKPVWNAGFQFPIRNRGTGDHNILEIKIRNKNKHTSVFRRENCLGRLRIGGLAEWITKQPNYITEAMWYPVFYKRHQSSRDQMIDEKRGEILIKFYFQNVDPEIFARGQHTDPRTYSITPSSETQSYRTVGFRREQGSGMSTVFGGLGAAFGIAQTMIMLL